ncbi:MAG: DUF736 family protein [Pseudomonadota bacterium]
MNLGTFTKHETGIITGTALTLINRFELEIRPIEVVGNGPEFRIYRQGTELEVGFARHEYGKRSGKAYLNMLIDTPELPQGVWMALVLEEDGSYQLKWSRPRKGRQRADAQDAALRSEAAASF